MHPAGCPEAVIGREHRESGLLARLLLAMPPQHPKTWREETVRPECEASFALVIERLRELGPIQTAEGPEPVVLRMTAEAKRHWIHFYNQHAKEQAELAGDLAAAWSKLEGYAARLALVVHLGRRAADGDDLASPDLVDERSVEAGVSLARWFAHEVRRVYALLADPEDPLAGSDLPGFVRRRGGSITARELTRCSRCYRSTRSAECALDELARAGIGRWQWTQPSADGGRPAKRFLLNSVDETPALGADLGGFVDVGV